MDKFVKRQKRKSSPGLEPDPKPNPAEAYRDRDRDRDRDTPSDNEQDDNEPTEVKLAMLSSLHPDLGQDLMLEFLLAHDGSVQAASESLKTGKHHPLDTKPSRTRTVGAQTSLKPFAIPVTSQPGQSPPQKKPKLLSRKGATLHLYDPDDISQHTPCTIIHNFLPEEEATALLTELLRESSTFQKTTFKLFDTIVSSPHTSAFYVGTEHELNQQKYEYVYNGAAIDDIRRLTPRLQQIKPLVQSTVNREIQKRIATHYGGAKLKHQSPDPWRPNAAFVNCYDGPDESVGWHSDQLTYLGPRAVIGSLSLGVTREFRVRRIVPPSSPSNPPSNTTPNQGQISIHLPHNSLLIMHAEMQEQWKHSIAPAPAIDPHPVAGRRRINITYRDYKERFHPRHTPRCSGCGVPAVLRVVQRRRENYGRYFWMCHAGNVPGKDGCDFFEWADFDEDGNPKTGTGTGLRTRSAGTDGSVGARPG